MFGRSFRRFFARKIGTIRNSWNKPAERAKRTKLTVEQLEVREVLSGSFTGGDIAVLQLATNSKNTTGSIVELAPSGASQTPALNVSIASTGSSALRFSDSGTSSFLSNSNDGTLLVISGYNTTDTTDSDLATVTTSDPASDRAVATLGNSTASFNLATTYTGTSGNQTRSATTTDDSNFYITDKGGLYTNGATSATLTTNILNARSFGGTVYVSSTAASSGVSTLSSDTATTLTSLSGIPSDSKIQDFYLLQSGQNGSTYDVLYTLDQGSSTASINKFYLNSGTWQSEGSYVVANASGTNINATSMIAQNNGSGGVNLYLVTTAQATGNSVVEYTDTGAYNGSVSITSANAVTLYTANPSTATLKGIAFAPISSSSTTLSASPASPQPASTAITFTAAVSPTTATGTVEFYNGSATIGQATLNQANGVDTAAITISNLTVGTDSITAVYAGNTSYTTSTSSVLSYQVTGTTSTTSLTASANPVLYGNTETLTASLSPTTATGTVQFKDGATVIGQATLGLANGNDTASISVTNLTAGIHSITAVYSGDSQTAGSTSSPATSLEVDQAPVITSPNGATFGVNVSGSDTITAAGYPTSDTFSYTGTLPAGVTFNALTGVLSGDASVAGTYPLTFTAANSVGSGPSQNFTLSIAPIFAQWSFTSAASAPDNSPAPTLGSGTATTLGMTNTYNGTGSTTSDDILSSPGVINSNQSEYTWRVRGSGNNGWATQAPEYSQGAEFDVSTAGESNIHFSFDWYSTTSAIRDLQVQYNTNVNNSSGWTNVGGNDSAGTYTAISNDFYSGFSDNITVDLSSISAVNNDSSFGIRLVSAYDSTGNLGNEYAIASSGGAAGATTEYVNGSGNWRFDNITFSGEVTTSSSITFTPASSPVVGTNVTIKDTITPSSGSNPTGTVTFYDGFTSLGSASVTAGTGTTGSASISLSTLSIGSHTITAQYNLVAGDNFADDRTSSVYTILGVTTSSVVTASPNSPQSVNTPVTFTDMITPSSGTAYPTGTVKFYDGTTQIGTTQTVAEGGTTNVGDATISISSLTAGTHNITAVYTPTGSFAASTSSAIGYAIYNGQSGPFTPGNLVLLQAGDGVNEYNAQAPLFLDEITTSGASVQQAAIPDTANQGAASISMVSENGSSVTITTSTTALFTPGEEITISGLTPSAYDGTFPITVLSSTQFTYTDTANIGTATIGTAYATPPNQPITLDLSAAAGNAQLNRSYDGSALTFDGIDSTINNGGLTSPATPTGSDNRVVAVVSGDPTIASDINTITAGPFYVGDDNRASIADSPTGPIYTAGHPNQAGGAVSQGVHEFDTEGPSIGNQISASTNIRGITIGFDNRMYFSTAGGLGAPQP